MLSHGYQKFAEYFSEIEGLDTWVRQNCLGHNQHFLIDSADSWHLGLQDICNQDA